MHRQIAAVLASVLILLASAVPARAQQTTATFAGIVTDKQGGVLPGVDVELTNEGTSAVVRQVTSATGEFLFTYVPVGSYSLKISLAGFKSFSSLNIPLGAAQNVRRTFSLRLARSSRASRSPARRRSWTPRRRSSGGVLKRSKSRIFRWPTAISPTSSTSPPA